MSWLAQQGRSSGGHGARAVEKDPGFPFFPCLPLAEPGWVPGKSSPQESVPSPRPNPDLSRISLSLEALWEWEWEGRGEMGLETSVGRCPRAVGPFLVSNRRITWESPASSGQHLALSLQGPGSIPGLGN